MHMLAAQEQRARDIELRAYDTLETWLNEHPPDLAPAEHDWNRLDLDSGSDLGR